MQSTVLKRFEALEETRTFEKGRFEVVQMGAMTVCRASREDGPYVSLPFMGADRYAHGATGD